MVIFIRRNKNTMYINLFPTIYKRDNQLNIQIEPNICTHHLPMLNKIYFLLYYRNLPFYDVDDSLSEVSTSVQQEYYMAIG